MSAVPLPQSHESSASRDHPVPDNGGRRRKLQTQLFNRQGNVFRDLTPSRKYNFSHSPVWKIHPDPSQRYCSRHAGFCSSTVMGREGRTRLVKSAHQSEMSFWDTMLISCTHHFHLCFHHSLLSPSLEQDPYSSWLMDLFSLKYKGHIVFMSFRRKLPPKVWCPVLSCVLFVLQNCLCNCQIKGWFKNP